MKETITEQKYIYFLEQSECIILCERIEILMAKMYNFHFYGISKEILIN